MQSFCGAMLAQLVTLLALTALVGCGQPSGYGSTGQDGAESQAGTSNTNSTNTPNGTADETESVVSRTTTVVDRDGYDEVIAKHRGKVVLVDFWATWCVPCVQQFPHTVEISRNYDREQLAVVAVSMDEPDDETQVREFLAKKEADFENLISTYGVGTEGFAAFELGDGGVPHYKLYDRQGNVRHTLTDSEGIEKLIDELLNES